MDVFSIFSDPSNLSYRGSLWLYQRTQGVWVLSGSHTTILDTEQRIREYTGLDLTFVRDRIEEGISRLVAGYHDSRCNLAVVICVETRDVESYAMIPEGWLPSGDPRRTE